MRISDQAIEYCRTLDAQHVIERLGLEPVREKNKWRCPSCGGSNLHVWPGAGRGAYCFSHCGGQAYDAIDLVEIVTGSDFIDSVRWLAGEFGFDDLVSGSCDRVEFKARLDERRRKIEERRRREREERMRRRSVGLEVWADVWSRLELGSVGRSYLEGRYIPFGAADRFGIRSVEDESSWGEILTGFDEATLDDAGLIGRRDDGTAYTWPFSAPFLVIPWWTEDGEIDFLHFRSLDESTDWRYLNANGHRPTVPYLAHFSLDAVDHGYPDLYVCEGELNALSVVIAGQPAIGSCGTGTWEACWSEEFRWWQSVTMLLDGDEGGRRFASNVRETTVEALGRDWVRQKLDSTQLDDGQDANDLLCDGRLRRVVDVE